MKTRALYYEDSQLREFTAQVLRCTKKETQYEVVLDQTAFYPEGGGQSWDVGALAGVNVLAVREVDGEIIHDCDGPLEENTTVTGRIHWPRRLDLMQQHTGEHIVSGIIYELFGFHNVGFHMGGDVITVDFDGIIPKERLREIQDRANQAVFANLPVRCWYPEEGKLPHVFYRTKKALPWPVRIVEVPGYDSCACCGVHVKRTGEIGIIKLLSCVKFHDGVRIEMVCGNRALALFEEIYRQNQLVSQAFSAKIMETGKAAQKRNQMLEEEKARAASLEKRLLKTIALAYTGQGQVVHFEENLSSVALRTLAEEISLRCNGTAVVCAGNDREGYQVCLVGGAETVEALGKALMTACRGKGGGREGFFQGRLQATKAEVMAFLR